MTRRALLGSKSNSAAGEIWKFEERKKIEVGARGSRFSQNPQIRLTSDVEIDVRDVLRILLRFVLSLFMHFRARTALGQIFHCK